MQKHQGLSFGTGCYMDGERMISPEGAVYGLTRKFPSGKSDVYLAKAAFKDKETLYLVLGHEFNHVQFNYYRVLKLIGNDVTSKVERTIIAKWERIQAKFFEYTDFDFQEFNERIYTSKYNQYLIPYMNVKPWIEY